MAGCEDVWPRFCKALGAYPQRLQSEDLASQAGDLFEGAVRYLRDVNPNVAARCPAQSQELDRLSQHFLRTIDQISSNLKIIAELQFSK